MCENLIIIIGFSSQMLQKKSLDHPVNICSELSNTLKADLSWLFKVANILVNNYFFHISHKLTRYSAIVHKFIRIYQNLPEFTQFVREFVCSTYELTNQFMKICAINLKKNNLYWSRVSLKHRETWWHGDNLEWR